MFFSRIVSLFFFFLTLGLVRASPTVVAKRQNPSGLITTFTNLKNSTDTILPQLDTLVANNQVTSANVVPLINQLQTAFNTAQTSVNTLKTQGPSSEAAPSDEEVAVLVAGILTSVTKTLDAVLEKGSEIPVLGGLLAGLDVTINEILLGVEILLAGVLKLVATLLIDVAGLLKALALGLILATLGL